jgi:hypothetical protein
MKNRIFSNIWGIGLGFFIAGLLWGVMRIEFTLLVPYYFMVAIFVDLGCGGYFAYPSGLE